MSILSQILKPLQRWTSQAYPIVEIPAQDLPNLLFGQQHLGTQDYFKQKCGQYHTVPLAQFPHRQFMQALADDKPQPEQAYLDYLTASWSYHYGPEKNTPELRAARALRFAEQYLLLSKSRQIEPIRVCQRPDGRLVVVDGNHRVSIAHQLGMSVRAEMIPLQQHLRSVATIPDEFYGSKRLDKPYQSIFHQGKELLEGRRKDVAERMKMIRPADLQGKSVIDFGCNLGMSCYLAAERGAREVLGIEGSKNIATAAIRLNALFAAPCSFRQHDLGIETTTGKFDTVFCFSIINHVQDKEAFVRTIDQALGGVMYFEGHANTTQHNYDYLLNDQRFSQMELLGYTQDGIHKTSASRPLWRCVKR
ncbi:methyltransferase domain-containing protein [Anatilimnocola floriformis]|uniref:methyltransferase domain-containing protein n=1 Tax=Anatilimnocola floriformis TaxID=2948575 RepID=UPI0020C56359|nr:methyltransferase domain-containing protein [Anatilimnocola floriformis]